MEEDSYEKNVVMYVVIGEPKHLAGKFVFLKFKAILNIYDKYKLRTKNDHFYIWGILCTYYLKILKAPAKIFFKSLRKYYASVKSLEFG